MPSKGLLAETRENCLGKGFQCRHAAGKVGARPSWSGVQDDPVHTRAWRGLAEEENWQEERNGDHTSTVFTRWCASLLLAQCAFISPCATKSCTAWSVLISQVRFWPSRTTLHLKGAQDQMPTICAGALMDSFEIAQWADKHGHKEKLFPAENLEAITR